jgi:hypothetical protein
MRLKQIVDMANDSITPQMSVTFTVTPADMKAFFAHIRRHHARIKRTRYLAYLVAALLSLYHAFTRAPDPDHRFAYFIANFIIIGGCTWFFGNLFLRFSQWRRFRSKEHPGLLCEHTITLTDEALIEITPINEARHLWSDLHSVINAKRHIFIFVLHNAAHIIPKRSFPNPEAAGAFFERAMQLFSDAKAAV